MSGLLADTDARPIRSISNLPSLLVVWIAVRIPVVTVTMPDARSRVICHRGAPSMSSGVRFTSGSGTGRSGTRVSDSGTTGTRTAEGVGPPVASRISGFERVGQILGKSAHETETRRRWPAWTT
jgi:hypothetical protein